MVGSWSSGRQRAARRWGRWRAAGDGTGSRQLEQRRDQAFRSLLRLELRRQICAARRVGPSRYLSSEGCRAGYSGLGGSWLWRRTDGTKGRILLLSSRLECDGLWRSWWAVRGAAPRTGEGCSSQLAQAEAEAETEGSANAGSLVGRLGGWAQKEAEPGRVESSRVAGFETRLEGEVCLLCGNAGRRMQA